MHVLIIPSWFETPQNPFRGSFVFDQALALKNFGLKVGVFVPPSKARSFIGVKEITTYWNTSNCDVSITSKQGLPIYRLNWWGLKATIFTSSRFRPISNLFKRYCDQHGLPDIIHAHSVLYGGFIAVKIGKNNNIPVIITEHSSIFMSAGKILPGQKKNIKYTLKNADRIMAVSSALSDKVKRFQGNLDIKILPNMVDTKFFQLAKQDRAPKPFKMLSIGALRYIKGFHILIRSFAKYFKGKDVTLKIIGEGRQRKKLESIIGRHDLIQQVSLCGSFSREEVKEEIRNSHVTISSSYKETFGITLIESLACGIPIISTKSGGPDKIINKDNGILVNTCDVDSLGSAMIYMHENYRNFDGEKIRQQCIDKYGAKNIIEELLKSYNELIDNKKWR